MTFYLTNQRKQTKRRFESMLTPGQSGEAKLIQTLKRTRFIHKNVRRDVKSTSKTAYHLNFHHRTQRLARVATMRQQRLPCPGPRDASLTATRSEAVAQHRRHDAARSATPSPPRLRRNENEAPRGGSTHSRYRPRPPPC